MNILLSGELAIVLGMDRFFVVTKDTPVLPPRVELCVFLSMNSSELGDHVTYCNDDNVQCG